MLRRPSLLASSIALLSLLLAIVASGVRRPGPGGGADDRRLPSRPTIAAGGRRDLDAEPDADPGACAETLAAGPGVMVASGDSGEHVPLSSFERDTTGAYLVTGVGRSVTISGVAPGEGRRLATDADQIGTDEITYTVNDGETRDGRFYYDDVN